MTHIRKTLVIPQLRGQWFRVVRKLTVNDIGTELHITPSGIEIPNTECVYIHKNTIFLTKDQVRHNQKCYDEWKQHIDLGLRYQITGYLIDTEELQNSLYFWDANLSNLTTFVMLKI